MNPFLSIITINYNNFNGLKLTIDSVISQTCQNFEWIIIDGGSNDGSKNLIVQNKEHFAFWCSEPDSGIYNAMNKGISKSSGEYLLFLNSGDVLYDDDVLEKVDRIGLKSDIVSGQMVRMDNGKILRYYDNNILLQLLNNTINHQATFIKRKLFDSLLYDEHLKIVSDWKFWLQSIIIRNASYEKLDMLISKQDMTGISLSGKFFDLEQTERRQVIGELFPPLVIESLSDYYNIRRKPMFKNIVFLRDKFPRLYIFVRKIVSFLTICCKKFG